MKCSLATSGCLLLPGVSLSGNLFRVINPASTGLSRVEARYYQKLPDREIRCNLCPRYCQLGDRERGFCGVRENQGGKYYTLVYGQVASLNVDP
ncbi:MAG: hypothetical protein RBR88_04975, partial [Candidatus Saccharicenans sp.]|nr:hypothetical protein [Candidatus Saccharicenans sp.]